MVSDEQTADCALAEEARIKRAYKKQKPAGYYSWFDPGNLFLVQERERLLLKRLKQAGRAPLAGQRLLEIGCGSGHWLREFVKWGIKPVDITGVDLRPDVLASAAELCPQGVTLRCSNGSLLDFPDESFDLVLQSLVFTSVLDQAMKDEMAREMLRVLKKDGLIIWYDFHVDNPWNPNVRGVRKAEITRLFSGCSIAVDRVSLALPVAKWLAPWSWFLCYVLDRLRVLNTHYLALIYKR